MSIQSEKNSRSESANHLKISGTDFQGNVPCFELVFLQTVPETPSSEKVGYHMDKLHNFNYQCAQNNWILVI